MTRRVFRSRLAVRDLIEHYAFLSESSIQVADCFITHAQESMDLLARFPHLGWPSSFQNPRLRSVRMWPVRGFTSSLIFYKPTPRRIVVIRVLHAARDIVAQL